jgi:hypothetical protein
MSKHSDKHGKLEKTIKLSNGYINLKLDTFDISADGDLRKVILFHNNFYLMFETNRKNTTQRFKNMIVLNKKGDFVEKVFVPDEFKDIPYYNIHVENDSLFVKESEFEESSFVLNEKDSELKPIKRREFKSLEDNTYNVYVKDNGEFGGTTFFQDKKTRDVYEIRSTPTAINKIDSCYFLTSSGTLFVDYTSVMKINKITQLQKSALDFERKHGSMFHKGAEMILDSTGLFISSSFVFNKKLLHIYNTAKGTYLGEIINGKIRPFYKFDFKFDAFLNQQYKNGVQVFSCFIHDKKYEKWINSSYKPFDDKDKQKSVYDKGAIMIIDGNSITIHVLN